MRTGDVTIKHVGGLCTVFAQAQEGVETGNGACVNASSHAQILYDLSTAACVASYARQGGYRRFGHCIFTHSIGGYSCRCEIPLSPLAYSSSVNKVTMQLWFVV